jgi:hypothetical protein
MTTSYIENDGLKICAKFLNKFIASDPLIDMSFDLESGLAAKEFYEKFKNDLKFLSCIYDKEKLINFKNLVFIIGEFFELSYDLKIKLAPQVAKIVHPKFLVSIKKGSGDFKNHKKLTYKEIFDLYFGFERMKSYYFPDNE